MLPYKITDQDWQFCLYLWNASATIEEITWGWESPAEGIQHHHDLLALARLKQLQFQGVIELLPSEPKRENKTKKLLSSSKFYKVYWLKHWLIFEVGGDSSKGPQPFSLLQTLSPQIPRQIKCPVVRLKMGAAFYFADFYEELHSQTIHFQNIQQQNGAAKSRNPAFNVSLRKGRLKLFPSQFVLLSAGTLRFFIYQEAK